VVLNLFAEGSRIQAYDLLDSRSKEISTQVNWHIWF